MIEIATGSKLTELSRVVGDIEQLLRDQVDGILENVFAADENYNLAFRIGHYASDLNNAGYGTAFRPIQNVLEQHFVLSVTKLFEQPSPRYATRSVPATVRILQNQAAEIRVQQRAAMLLRFSRTGVDVSCLGVVRDGELLIEILAYYESSLPSTTVLSGLAAGRTLNALSFRRNKVIAHNEETSASSFPQTTWGEARALVDLAKSFIDVISTGYLSYILSGDGGTFMPSKDAERSATLYTDYLRPYSDMHR